MFQLRDIYITQSIQEPVHPVNQEVTAYIRVQQMGLQEVLGKKQQIGKFLEKLDLRKATGPDGVSGWTLNKCREQVVEPILDVMTCSVKEGKVPREWKRANIVMAYKEGKMEPPGYRLVSLTSVQGNT